MTIVYIDNTTLPLTQPIAATIGFFDGVHLGHRHLIHQLKQLAKDANLATALITFAVHPRKVLNKEYQPQLLTNLDERLNRLSTTGVDYCYVIDFDKELSEMNAADFIQRVLVGKLHTQLLLIGYDHRFGKDRAQGFEDYQAYGKACGMQVVKAEKLAGEQHVSSTTIRHLLENGDVRTAEKLLSYHYSLEGRVVAGNQLGRTIGFPTANIKILDSAKIVPPEGVYAAVATVADKQYEGMVYVGNRPTISNAGEKRIEIHLFDFVGDIYGEKIHLDFLEFIRPGVKFSGLEDLQRQLTKDRENVLNVFKGTSVK